MKRSFLRIGSLLLALVMLLSTIPAFAAEEERADIPAAELPAEEAETAAPAEALPAEMAAPEEPEAEPAALPPPAAEPDATTIPSVSITLDAPVPGAHPDYTAEFPAGAHYYSYPWNDNHSQNDINWHDETFSYLLFPDTSLFQGEHVYEVTIYLTAENGYSFSDSTTATLNGQTAPTKLFDSTRLQIKYTFPALTPTVTAVFVSLDAPVPGAHPDYTAGFNSGVHYYSAAFNSTYFRNDISWKDVTADRNMYPDSDVFLGGHEYEVTVYLTAETGYVFNGNTTARVNGEDAQASMVNNKLKVQYTFPALPVSIISSVSITLDAPAVGAHPDYTTGLPSGAHYYSSTYSDDTYRNDVAWWDITDVTAAVDPEDGVFQLGHIYKAEVFLTPREGYAFNENTAATVNGQDAQYIGMWNGQLRVEYTFPVLKETIPSVSITLDAPAIGAHPDYTAVFPSGANYYSASMNNVVYQNDIIWRDVTGDNNIALNVNSGVFEIGHTYQVTVYLTAMSGYVFTDSTTATVNGQTALANMEDSQLRVEYTFPVLSETIPSVSITLDAPAVGAHPDYTAEFPDGAHCYSASFNTGIYQNDIIWRDVTGGNNTSLNVNSGVFAAGHTYQVTVYLTAEDGYVFTDSTTVSLNGQTAQASVVNSQLKVQYTFPALPEIISSVSITLDAPAVGAHPDYTAEFPSGVHCYSASFNTEVYQNDIIWRDVTGGINTSLNVNSGVFAAGHTYQVTVYLTAEDGYVFTDSTTVSLNEQTAQASVVNSQLKVQYTFPALPEIISSVSITLDAPAVGAHPDYTAEFPSGAHYYSEEGDFYRMRNNIYWTDMTTEGTMDPDNDVFQAGYTYRVNVFLTAESGYAFSSSTAAVLNGNTVQTSMTGETLQITYDFPALPEALSITTQPANKTGVVGKTVQFQVVASGSGLTYQWQYKKPSGEWTDCGSFSGYDTATVTVPVTAARNGYQFRCKVTSGGTTLTSSAATLTVFAITAQPQNVTAAAGENVQFSVTARGSGVTYQWQYLKPGGSWTNCGSFAGYNTKTLTVPATTARNGYQFRCKATCQGTTITSSAATLTVGSAAPSITTQPGSKTGVVGKNVQFTVAATGSSLTYQWQYKKPSGSWTDCGSFTGYNTATVTVPVTAARNDYQFRCKVTSGGTTVTSDAATLTVFAITAQPQNKTAAAGENVQFSVTTRGSGVTYQWQYKKPSGSWTDCGSFAGYNTKTLTVPATTARNGYQFRCKATCQSTTITSSAATLTVGSAALSITTQPSSKTGVVGKNAQFTVVLSSTTGVTYQWQYLKPGGNWTNCGSFSGYNTATVTVPVTAARNGYKFRCVITKGSTTLTSDAATLTVFAITAQPQNKTAAAGTDATFTVTARGSGVTYQWQYLKPGGSWTNCGSFAGYNTKTLTVPVTTARNGYKFRCVVTCQSTNITSSAATLTVG